MMMRVNIMNEMKRMLLWKPQLFIKIKSVKEGICSLQDGKSRESRGV